MGPAGARLLSVLNDVLSIALFVEGILENLEIPHVVGGSLASSLHGIPRATQDIDFVVGLEGGHVPDLVLGLADDFYVDRGAVEEAVRTHSRFNAIHLRTMFKVDFYVVSMSDETARGQLRRGKAYEIDPQAGFTLVVASAEDTIVQKLRWFRLGDEVGERQWRDALGVLAVRGQGLDKEYMEELAGRFGVRDLLDRALKTIADADE